VTTRLIHKSSWQCRHEARELLQAIFAGELLAPSRCLWIISPWISNVPVVDNEAQTFQPPDTTWGRGTIRLADVLRELARRGTQLVIATRPDAQNELFLEELQRLLRDAACLQQLTSHRVAQLHEKGIAGDEFYLGGSMNLTWNGIEVLEESLHYTTEDEAVATVRLQYRQRWGGVP
jgi:hypothetical protein